MAALRSEYTRIYTGRKLFFVGRLYLQENIDFRGEKENSGGKVGSFKAVLGDWAEFSDTFLTPRPPFYFF